MAKVKEPISGKIVSPHTIEVIRPEQSKLIPGQKVLIYKATGRNIVSADGRIIGKKERVLGSGEVIFVGNKLMVKPSQTANTVPLYKIKGATGIRGKVPTANRPTTKPLPFGTVLIKAIEE